MYFSAQEAADELGISIATLYSYVSRKGLRSHQTPGSKARLYWREDIERLKRAPQPANREVLVPNTSITLLTKEGPYYRGRSALALAETESLESTCEILWGPLAKDAFAERTAKRPRLYDVMLKNIADATTFDKISAVLPVLERANPRAYDLSPAGYYRAGVEIMRSFAALICRTGTLKAGPLHEVIATALNAPERYSDIIRRLFVLYADHDLDPSSYAVRAVANSGVSAYRIVGAGLASAMGRRLTFGRIEAFAHMMQEIMNKPDPADAILRRIREGEPIYGFGSRLYEGADPRAASLLRSLNETQGDDLEVRRLNAAISAAHEATGHDPDFALVAIFIDYKLGLVGSEGGLARLARMAGWMAHAVEQYHGQDLVRPKSEYVGILPDHNSSNPPLSQEKRSGSSDRARARSAGRRP